MTSRTPGHDSPPARSGVAGGVRSGDGGAGAAFCQAARRGSGADGGRGGGACASRTLRAGGGSRSSGSAAGGARTLAFAVQLEGGCGGGGGGASFASSAASCASCVAFKALVASSLRRKAWTLRSPAVSAGGVASTGFSSAG